MNRQNLFAAAACATIIVSLIKVWEFVSPFLLQIEYGKILEVEIFPFTFGLIIDAISALFLWTFSKYGLREARAILLQNDSAYKPFERTVLGLAHTVIALLFPVILVTFGAIFMFWSGPLEAQMVEAVVLLFTVLGMILPQKCMDTITNVVVPSMYRSRLTAQY